MFCAQKAWALSAKRYKLARPRAYCVTSSKNGSKGNNAISNSNHSDASESSIGSYNEVYRQLDKLDFMNAAKILFTDAPKKKKFGLDFHLVQLFFACMPSLAVYLVAQYARHEMRRMDAELELKQQEEEKKVKEKELEAKMEKEQSDKELSEMKVRLNKLEEVVQEIAVETRKQPGASKEDASGKESKETAKPITSGSEPGIAINKGNHFKEVTSGSSSVPVSSPETQNGGPSHDAKS